jgi:hypothetical protein
MPSKDVMKKFAKRKLHSGSKTGPVVTNPRQAKAIAASEARAEKKHGGRYPDRKKARDKRLSKESL